MIGVIIVLVIVGVCLHLIRTYIPMEESIKTIITVVVILCLCLWLLQAFGIVDVPVPRVRGR